MTETTERTPYFSPDEWTPIQVDLSDIESDGVFFWFKSEQPQTESEDEHE